MDKITKPSTDTTANRALQILANAGLMTVSSLSDAIIELSKDPKVTQRMLDTVAKYIKTTYFGTNKKSKTRWLGSKKYKKKGLTKKQTTFASIIGNLKRLAPTFEVDFSDFQQTGTNFLNRVSDLVGSVTETFAGPGAGPGAGPTTMADKEDKFVFIGNKKFSIDRLNKSIYGSMKRGDTLSQLKSELKKRKIRIPSRLTRKEAIRLLVDESIQQPGSFVDIEDDVPQPGTQPGTQPEVEEQEVVEQEVVEPEAEPDYLEGIDIVNYEDLDFDNYFANQGGLMDTLDQTFKNFLTNEDLTKGVTSQGMMTDSDIENSKTLYDEKYSDQTQGTVDRTESSPEDDPEDDPDPDDPDPERQTERETERETDDEKKRETDDDDDDGDGDGDGDNDKPSDKPSDEKSFRVVPAGESILRAMKRLPSDNISPDDFETEQESKDDKETIDTIQDDLREGIWYDLDNQLDHLNFHNERLRIDSSFLPRKFLDDIDSYQKKQSDLKTMLDTSAAAAAGGIQSIQPTFISNFTHDTEQPFVRQSYDQSDFGRDTFTQQRESGVVFVF